MQKRTSNILRVSVRPEMLRWALERSGKHTADIAKQFPALAAWGSGDKQPTLKQLEAFAKATYTPIGFLFLAEPPEEQVPIPDFRTIADQPVARPSPNLLDTLYLCQQRQAWYRRFALMEGEEPLKFVDSIRLTDGVDEAAERIRKALGFNLEERRKLSTWTEALRRFIEEADAAGVLVMVSGVVGSNNKRKLNPKEFRGFALVDDLAPVVFVNGADTKAAQMFTLAHELVHIWLGESALSDSQARAAPHHAIERWCNQVAAELLAPLTVVREEYDPKAELRDELDRLAKRFKVSTLVVLRRIRDVGGLSAEAYWNAYEAELDLLQGLPAPSGGDFYRTVGARVSKRFAHSIVVSTLEGQSSYTEALRLLGMKKMSTFQELGNSLGLSA